MRLIPEQVRSSLRGLATALLPLLAAQRVPDAQRDEKIREGCEVYASAAERATRDERTISMDGLTGVQALERKHPDLPMQPGHVLRREFEYIRHGTLSWFINFDVVSGKAH